ncbi:MAG: selenide, water dikinase SelD, partial [Merismopedia sp. SIO2A8]|nr:selenide, water dikinase SelD [Merismopedia sp. SIO2A8]
MQSTISPVTKDLVLVGGGHSHAIALKLLGMNPMPGVRLTLITDVYHTPYSGMLPGYVAGLYTYDECHIDLRPLSQFAQARLIIDRAIALDLKTNQVICANHPPISFDVLSLDIGITPATITVPGAKDYAIPVKPISKFLTYWEQLMAEIQTSSQTLPLPQTPLKLGIVGGGAGGVELALSVQARLDRLQQQTSKAKQNIADIHLFHRGPELLPERHPRIRRLFQRLMVNRGIQIHLNDEVVALDAPIAPLTQGRLREVIHEGLKGEANQKGAIGVNVITKSGKMVECDRVFWVTSASAAKWISQSDLATDAKGFIQVNDNLQSISHPNVFAAGDIATMVNHPRPKAGVFAVRQGQPLYENLCRAVQNQPLKPFTPQKEFLILVGTGYERAIASRGSFQLGPSKLLWQWKDRIDRKFMDRFTALSPMAEGSTENKGRQTQNSKSTSVAAHSAIQNLKSPMPCSGCASKIGKSVLDRVLTQIKATSPSQVLIGLDQADDAAVLQVPPDKALVQTVDYFRALVDDPFLAGQITTHHCLNDLYAMGATPHSAMAIASLPYATSTKLENTLFLLLSGVVKILTASGAELIGGHTVESRELGLGLSCNGLVQPDQVWRKAGMQPGDQLILTKALGTGTLFAADMQLRAKGRWIEGAIASMLQSNRAAADCFRQYQATACTDVSGFGLVGHLLEMIQYSTIENPIGDQVTSQVKSQVKFQVGVNLSLSTIPVLFGTHTTIEQGL